MLYICIVKLIEHQYVTFSLNLYSNFFEHITANIHTNLYINFYSFFYPDFDSAAGASAT